jgi:hypothetical protein
MANGVAKFQANDFAGAIAEFDLAYKEKPKASPLINLSLCYRAQKSYAKAIAALDLALARHADSMDDQDKQAAGAAIGEMRIAIGYIAVSTHPAGAMLAIDGVDQPSEVAGRPIPLEPGHHTVSAKLAGYVATTEDVEVTPGGGERPVSILLPLAGPTEKRRLAILIPGLVLDGVGLGVGIGGAVLAGSPKCLGNGNAQAQPACTPPCDLSAQRRNGGLLIGAGVVLLAVGIPLTFIGAKKVPVAPKTAARRPDLLVGPASAGLRWAF